MLREEVGAIRENVPRAFHILGLIDPGGNLACQIAEHEADHRPAQHGLQESPHAGR